MILATEGEARRDNAHRSGQQSDTDTAADIASMLTRSSGRADAVSETGQEYNAADESEYEEEAWYAERLCESESRATLRSLRVGESGDFV
jgi:hypothetical protein